MSATWHDSEDKQSSLLSHRICGPENQILNRNFVLEFAYTGFLISNQIYENWQQISYYNQHILSYIHPTDIGHCTSLDCFLEYIPHNFWLRVAHN